MYEVEILPRVYKALKRLPKQDVARIVEHMRRLAQTPRPPGCKKIHGREDVYRIRVGAYRILYRIRDAEHRVTVLNIGHRKEIYRHL